jgi:hypothetical protein
MTNTDRKYKQIIINVENDGAYKIAVTRTNGEGTSHYYGGMNLISALLTLLSFEGYIHRFVQLQEEDYIFIEELFRDKLSDISKVANHLIDNFYASEKSTNAN